MSTETASLPLGPDALRRASPHELSFLFLDRLESYQPRKRRLVAAKNVSLGEPILNGHFPGFPILPGVLVIESLSQACRLLVALDHLTEQGTPEAELAMALETAELPIGLLVESAVRHSNAVFPGDTLEMDVQITGREGAVYTLKVEGRVGGQEVGRGKLKLLWTEGADYPEQPR
ncbi:MAG TPA: 3-hydroxyacyl-ACP dehydratase FabZ family protein [Longimicrobium sp.]|nr:3-hydroxyacyl-ACP dehydratase FabZ family protein [Longimicrobium sp.]